MPDTLLLDTSHAGICLVTLNRPEVLNALNTCLLSELAAELERLERDDSCRAVVITGSRKAFAAGADINEMAERDAVGILNDPRVACWQQISRFSKPLIAAVNGFALGGGCELAMHADLIVAGRSARFCQPEIRIGIMPGIGGTQRLVRAVGKVKAMRMALTGKPITAHEAWTAGLVSDLVADDQVIPTAIELARTVAAMPPLAAEQIKECILLGMDAPLETALAMERRANALLFASRDQKEGMQAFIEKRPPKFEGR